MNNGAVYDRVVHHAGEQGISIRNLEERAMLANGTIGKWKTSTPRLDSVLHVSKVLNVPLEELIGNDEE